MRIKVMGTPLEQVHTLKKENLDKVECVVKLEPAQVRSESQETGPGSVEKKLQHRKRSRSRETVRSNRRHSSRDNRRRRSSYSRWKHHYRR